MDSSVPGDSFKFLQSMWVEICFAVFFPCGWLLVHKFLSQPEQTQLKKARPAARKIGTSQPCIAATKNNMHKAVEEAVSAGRMDDAVKSWRLMGVTVPTYPDTMRLVVKAILSVSPSTLVDEIVHHMEQHKSMLSDGKVPMAVLEVLSSSPDLMDEMYQALVETLGMCPSSLTYEALLGGHAAAGNEERVKEVLAEMRSSRVRVTPRGHALMIKGFLLCRRLDAALAQVDVMRKQGFFVPPFALSMMLKLARDQDRHSEVLDNVKHEVAESSEALNLLLEDCARSGHFDLATEMEGRARAARGGVLPLLCYGPLLRINVAAANVHALELLEECQKLNVELNDGVYINLISRCAETRFLRFAEELARVLRAKGRFTVSMYSALMKVYAYCGLYGRACDLYTEIKERDLKPDAVMYGCLRNFAVEAGRTDLLQELFDLSPDPGIPAYVSLIRAAGRGKNVDRAFEVFEMLTNSSLRADRGICNCVLDACVTGGDLARARSFLGEVRSNGGADVVSYNTLLKGFCAIGDMKTCQEISAEMSADGVKPDEITFNCMINAAVIAGNLRKAWDLVDTMETSGVKIDKYTVSIMLKGLKCGASPRDLHRSLGMLDRVGLDLNQDGALLNIAIETCVRHREMKRLQELVNAWEKSKLQPGVHTYASLIKACSTLKKLDRCRELWKQMVEERGTDPNDVVLGCMMDALVCNGKVTEAVTIFREWKDRVGVNMILYSTIAKGFAAQGRAEEAMELWKEIRDSGSKMNSVVYNSLIDVQARIGNMEQAHTLFAGMEQDEVKPDSITYSTMVKGYCASGNVDEAFKVFKSTQRAGMAPDCIVYNTILDGCTRHNRMDLADLVLKDFEVNNIVPSIFTLGILVKMYGRRRMLDKAFEVLETLPAKYGLTPNVQVKTCLISACVCNNAVDRGIQVFEEMKTQGGVDAKAYGVIISGFLRAGRPERAAQMVEEAYGLKTGERILPPRQDIPFETIEHLLMSLGNNGLKETVGVPLLASLHSAGVPVHSRLLSKVIRSDGKARFP